MFEAISLKFDEVHKKSLKYFFFQKNQAELVLEITGFQLEYKEELEDWKDATRKNVVKSKLRDQSNIKTISNASKYLQKIFLFVMII